MAKKKQLKPTQDELDRQTREFDAAFRNMVGRSNEKFKNLDPLEAFRGLYPDEVIDRAKAKRDENG